MPNLNTLNMLLHCYLTFIASNKKSVNNTYPFVPCILCVKFPWLFLRYICLFVYHWISVFTLSCFENDFITLFGVFLAFRISGFTVFKKFGKISFIFT